MNVNSQKQRPRDTSSLIADFAETTHVPTTYINSSLSAVGSHSQISAAVHILLQDLELASSTASEKLNALVDDMLRTAPRLGYDIEVLRGGLMHMHSEAAGIEPKRQALERKGQAAIEKLAMLENVKLQMQETRKVFDDAQAWNPPESIEESIAAMLALGEYGAASKEAMKYEGLLQVFRGTAEFSRRKAVIERVKKKLLDVKQEGAAKLSLDLVRSSGDSQRSSESAVAEDNYYSSFIKRAFKS